MSGGYEAPGTGVVLDFAGTEHDGLEVTIDSVSMGQIAEIWELQETMRGKSSAAGRGAMLKLLAAFSGCLESWNLTRRGEPVPATYEGLLTVDHKFVLELISAWVERTTGSGGELGKDSTSGGSSEAERTAAAMSSASRAS